MNWHWVGRARYDLILEMMDRWHEAWIAERGSHEITRNRLVELTEKLVNMQRSGYQIVPASAPDPAPSVAFLKPELQAALRARFNPNSAVLQDTIRQIEEWKIQGREDSWIIDRIWNGDGEPQNIR